MDIRPTDIGVWLADIDVNCLSAAEADDLAQYDITTDVGLEQVMREWIAPRFARWNEQNQREMREVLSKSSEWTDEQLGPIFREFAYPTGAHIEVGRFMFALRRTFLP